MCLELYPECGDGGDGCCERRLEIALEHAGRNMQREREPVPRVYVRKVDFQLYACWSERDGKRTADCIEACCPVCAKADFIGTHFLVDKAEADAHGDTDRQKWEVDELKRIMILSDRAMWSEWYSQRDVIRRAGLGTIPLPDGWVEIGDGD